MRSAMPSASASSFQPVFMLNQDLGLRCRQLERVPFVRSDTDGIVELALLRGERE